MRALSLVDYLFLLLENYKQPMHVAGLCIFELPENCDDHFVNKLISSIDGQIPPNFPFNQVLFGGIFWKQVKNFQIHQHCHYHQLKDGSEEELCAVISRLHERRLERSRPLWSLHLIDGLSPEKEGGPGRFALYLKTHHAVVDGVAAMRIFQRSLSCSPDETNPLPVWAHTLRRAEGGLKQTQKKFGQIIKEQIGSIKPVAKEIFNNIAHKKSGEPNFISSFDAPRSPLNQRIGTSRYLSIRAFDKDRFTKIAQKFSVSTNDVILAICSHALREYLIDQDDLPKDPLIAFVPISLRDNDSAIGNQISFLPANLGTHIQDHKARLLNIHHSLKLGKERFMRMTQAQIINYTALNYAWAGVNLAARIYPKKQAFNLVISNIPGDDTPLYLNSAKLTSMYPVSVLFDGQALNISFTNYQNRIDFGITACQNTLPHIHQLPLLLDQALKVYESL